MEEMKIENKRAVKTEYVTTTQKVIPVKDIYKGIIITNDGRYIKILEVKPIPFSLMTSDERNMTINGFSQLLRNAPNSLQISTITTPVDISDQLAALDEHQLHETSDNCLKVIDDYRQRLINSKSSSVSRRFFLSFEYEGRSGLFKSPNIYEIATSLNRTAQTLINDLETCGNKVVDFNPNNPNYAPAEILYKVINRKANAPSFEDKVTSVYKNYYDKFGERNLYVPPNMFYAPNEILFGNKKYVVIDGMYYRYFYIPSRHYAEKTFAGWLNPFITACQGVDVNIYLKKVDESSIDRIQYQLGRSIAFSISDYATNGYESKSKGVAEKTFTAADYLRDGLLEEGNSFMYMSVLITAYGETPQIVNQRADELMRVASKFSLKLFPCDYLGANAFESSLPLCKLDKSIYDLSKRNVLSCDAASIYPFASFEINDPNGIYFGNDYSNGTMAIIDIFNQDRLTNANIFIAGTSGSGKTYSLSLLATRSRANHIPVIIIAPEKQHEFRRLCNALGGEFIEIAPGSPNRINIMEILRPDQKAIENNKAIYESNFDSSYLAGKVTSLKTFFGLYLEDMTIQEKQLLDRAIMETYRRFGITLDNNSLIDPEYDDGRYRKMPIISDLVETLEQMAKTNDALRRLVDIIPYFTEGSSSSFNGQTNVDLNNEFIVIGLEKMKDDDLKLGMFMTMEYAWAKIREDGQKKKLLIMDEWWRLSSDKSSADYSMKIARTIRSFKGSLILATQQLKDIFAVDNGKYGEGVLANCYTKILLGMTPDDADRVQKILSLTDYERNELITYKKGMCLLLLNNIKMKLQFVSSEFENRLITTNPEELAKILAEKQRIDEPHKEEEHEEINVVEVFADNDITQVLDDESFANLYLNEGKEGTDGRVKTI